MVKNCQLVGNPLAAGDRAIYHDTTGTMVNLAPITGLETMLEFYHKLHTNTKAVPEVKDALARNATAADLVCLTHLTEGSHWQCR